MSALCFHLFFLTSACLALLIRCQVDYQHGPPSSANLSTVWKMSGADPTAGSFGTQYAANPVLLRSIAAPEYRNLYFGAGFYCVTPCNTFVFGVYAVSTVNQSDAYKLNANANSVMLVWSANRDHQVQKSATLNFTGDGDLILRDADGSLVWSSGTSGRSVVGMNMTESGNLVLFDQDNKSVWQSFDHPVDSLLPGQRLLVGKSLTPSTSSTINMTTSNQFYLTVRPDGLYLYAFVGYQVPRLYYSITTDQFMAMSGRNDRLRYISLKNGSLAASFPASTKDAIFFLLPTSQWLQFMRFDSDGRLRLYEWSSQSQLSWTAQDILELDNCDYPFVRGDYGICSNGQCSCPMPGSSAIGSYFRQVDDQKTNPGCILDTPISCQQSIEDHQLILVHNVSDFNYVDRSTGVITDEESCKQACLGNCSCKAALFRYDNDASNGSCLLASESLSLVGSSTGSAFLKVHITHSQRFVNKKGVLSYTLGGVAAALVLLATVVFAIVRCRENEDEADNDELGELPGMPARFTFESLKVATNDFSSKIGEGGFSSVFKGQLGDQQVAVKQLHRAAQGKKEFVAEVQTIGSLHHINLVRLIGFCTEKSHRLLVYEYVSRGSLDKWIYYADNKSPLGWNKRHKVIIDIAKGLSYLHEDCRQRIAHLDIKPQNILVDDNFDAKVADFGLCKLIDRGQSRVVTRMRGTPGYLAPEWLTSQITEKVDVYSFGVVVMEIICGRKTLDYSQPEENVHLTSILQEKARNDQLVDLIDKGDDEMQMHREEVIQMMKLAMWCLQIDYNKRPQMSVVVKVLEGTMNVETNIEYNFVTMVATSLGNDGKLGSSGPLLASHLSGPR